MKESPSSEVMPSNINPKASKVWVHVLRRYSDLIFGSKVVKDQWFRASRLFEQACKSRDLEPYSGSNSLREISAKLRKLC